MATNDWSYTIAMLLLLNVIFLFSGASAKTANIEYQIANANRLVLTTDANLAISFSKASSNSRFKRQADAGPGAVDGGAVGADTPTGSGNGSLTLPDETSGTTLNSSAPVTASPAPGTVRPTQSTQDPFEGSDLINDFHKYYESSIQKNRINDFWVELQSTPKHQTLSDGHRVAVVIPLKFTFYFYGHGISNVTVATGGFIYMSPFLHQWLTATQYIAPLMANFDPSFADGSSIFYKSFDTHFIVEWRDVVLKDQNNTGKFSFQAILRDDSSITFVYKNVPIPISDISNEQHPVKIGLSDAYYNDTYLPAFNVKKRTIYEYHKVIIPTNTIKSGTVVIISSLPTCNRLDSCDMCTKHINVSFDCRWCNKIGRCSDGLDWYRQHWDLNGCKETSYSKMDQCQNTAPTTRSSDQSPLTTNTTPTGQPQNFTTALPTTTLLTSVASTTPTSPFASPTISKITPNQNSAAGSQVDFVLCNDGNCKKNEFPVAVVVVIVLAVVGLLGCLAGWVYYAYSHPTSRSGMWLMEHRPSQIKAKIKFWKDSGDSSAKYKAESEA